MGTKIADQYRQGDVYIEAVARIPDAAEDVTPGGPVILAEGEATGHAHRIDAGSQVRFFWSPKEKRNYLRVLPGGKPVALKHEEHDPITLPPGDYLVKRQREYVPGEVPRYVAD